MLDAPAGRPAGDGKEIGAALSLPEALAREVLDGGAPL